MTAAINILGYVLIVILVLLCITASISIIQYLYAFHRRKCKHCGSILEYKGLKENEKESHFLFHCKNCGAWEEVPKEEMFRNCDYDKK